MRDLIPLMGGAIGAGEMRARRANLHRKYRADTVKNKQTHCDFTLVLYHREQ